MSVGIDEVGEDVILDDLGHQTSHGAACTGDEVQDGLTPAIALQRPLDPLDLAPQASNPSEQLLPMSDRVHGAISLA